MPQASFTKSVLALAIAAITGAAGAQQQPQAVNASAAKEDSLVLDVVVVTAQKREQVLKDVPISMTVLGQGALERGRVNGLDDLQNLVPGISMESQSGYNTVTIRGVGGGGLNAGFDPRTGVYVDGIFMGQAAALRQPLFDVQQVEVLRGPQGYLFGRNTVAGAINITTTEPGKSFEGSVRGVIGSSGTKEVYATMSGPLSENVRAKISLASEAHDGFTNNLFNGQQLDDLKRETVRAQLLVQASQDLKLSVSADASTAKQYVTYGENLAAKLPKRTANLNVPNLENNELSGVSGTATYTLAGGSMITAIVGQRTTKQEAKGDQEVGPADFLSTHYFDDSVQNSQELRIASPNKGGLRYVAGIFHLSETATGDRKAFLGVDSPVPGGLVKHAEKVTTDSNAIFGSVDYDITPALVLNLGARYTQETKDVRFDLGSTPGFLAGALGVGTRAAYADSRVEGKLSPSAGLTYALNKNQNIYSKYSRGFKSGGWNTDFVNNEGAANPAFDTETVDSFELGTKGSAMGGQLSYDLAVFTSKFKDFQVFQYVALAGGGSSINLRNAAEVDSRGLEGSLSMRVTKNLDVGAQFSATKATFKSFSTCSPTVDCSGNQLPYSPDFTAGITAKYGLPAPDMGGKFDLYGEYSYHGESFGDPTNDAALYKIPSRSLVNTRVTFTPDSSRWEYSLWARNLFDNDAVALRGRLFTGIYIDRRIDPRVVGLEVKYNFD
jgi:iron complex outermembrane receptor protein